MNRTAAVSLVVVLASAASVARAEWAIGPGVSYASGISDVLDVYERNLLARPGVVDVDTVSIPIGFGLFSRYQADSGLRFDAGVGPAFITLGVESDSVGDADHFELPVYATVGYTFSPGSDRSAYARAGLAYHIVSGDFEVGSDPGLFAAVGMELGRDDGSPWGFEVSIDDSTVEFTDPAVVGNTELNSYDVMLSFFMLF